MSIRLLLTAIVFSFILQSANISLAAQAKPIQITGLVIDARGLGLERTMSPTIIDRYGFALTLSSNESNVMTNQTSIEYYTNETFKDIISGNSCAGSNYLTIRAIGVENERKNPVVAIFDAERITRTPGMQEIFTQGRIVFIQ
ncbi:hypothetical protein [Dendrosporobacter sp. 1207_IL3150]|uniref:hypothetical protein n=1 Tax=Dendrosporobacter sp. 1207_IL3150 TaxID=3084054 RepID=UPI002FDA9AE3